MRFISSINAVNLHSSGHRNLIKTVERGPFFKSRQFNKKKNMSMVVFMSCRFMTSWKLMIKARIIFQSFQTRPSNASETGTGTSHNVSFVN